MLSRLTAKVLSASGDCLCALLSRLESLGMSCYENIDKPPVFIVGAPRCGSTLTYQLLATFCKYNYFSNLHCALRGFPAVASFFTSSHVKRTNLQDFSSYFGQTNNLLDVSECGEYWYRFFMYVDTLSIDRRGSFLTPGHRESFKASFGLLQRSSPHPLLIKNLYNIFRIREISEIYNTAKFIFIRRSMAEHVLSILLARKKFNSSFEKWWSIKTHDSDRLLAEDPVFQVISQISSINNYIQENLQELPNENVLSIDFGDIRNSPESNIQRIAHFSNTSIVPYLHDELKALSPFIYNNKYMQLPQEMQKLFSFYFT